MCFIILERNTERTLHVPYSLWLWAYGYVRVCASLAPVAQARACYVHIARWFHTTWKYLSSLTWLYICHGSWYFHFDRFVSISHFHMENGFNVCVWRTNGYTHSSHIDNILHAGNRICSIQGHDHFTRFELQMNKWLSIHRKIHIKYAEANAHSHRATDNCTVTHASRIEKWRENRGDTEIWPLFLVTQVGRGN